MDGGDGEGDRPGFNMGGANAIALMGPEELAKWDRRFTAKVQRQQDIWGDGLTPEELCDEWQGAQPMGYGAVKVRGIQVSAHRAAYVRAHGPIPPGLQVRHRSCSNPLCVRAEHLTLGTAAQNAQDKAELGRTRAMKRRRLTPEDDRKAWEMRAEGRPFELIGQLLGMDMKTAKRAIERHAQRLATGALEAIPEPPGAEEAGEAEVERLSLPGWPYAGLWRRSREGEWWAGRETGAEETGEGRPG